MRSKGHSKIDISTSPLAFVSDSSSLILLAKARLLGLLCVHSHIFTTNRVKNEIEFESEDSILIQGLIIDGRIMIRDADTSGLPDYLGPGEKSAIALFKDCGCDYLIMDDKKGANFCRANAIPYINALLVPSYLKSRGAIDDHQMDEGMRLLSQIGYYSPWIREYADRNRDFFGA